LKNNPVKLEKLGVSEIASADLDIIFLTIPEDTEKDAIKLFVNTAHTVDTLVLPIISSETDIDSIIDTVIDNDYDGIVTEETQTSFIANLSAALHNKGRQLTVSATYTEDLDLYDIGPYIDKLIVKVPSQDAFAIESAILDIRMQIPEEKIIIELDNNTEVGDILDTYNIIPLWD
jgi:hypothetical protein